MEEDKIIKIDKPKLEFDQIADFLENELFLEKLNEEKWTIALGRDNKLFLS